MLASTGRILIAVGVVAALAAIVAGTTSAESAGIQCIRCRKPVTRDPRRGVTWDLAFARHDRVCRRR